MARRIILGKYGSAYRFRVAQPGFDAALAGLDNLIFDADNIPARVAATGIALVDPAVSPHQPTTRQIAHTASPSLCIGVAEPTTTPGYNADGMWRIIMQDPKVNNGNPTSLFYDLPEIHHQYCTPWMFYGDNSGGNVQSIGWKIQWNSSTISLINYSSNGIRVRWAALEF